MKTAPSIDKRLTAIIGLRQQTYATGKTVYSKDFMHSEWVACLPKGYGALQNVMFAP